MKCVLLQQIPFYWRSEPKKVLAEAYTSNPVAKADGLAASRRVRKLCAEAGVPGRRYRLWWRLLGLHDPSMTTPAAGDRHRLSNELRSVRKVLHLGRRRAWIN